MDNTTSRNCKIYSAKDKSKAAPLSDCIEAQEVAVTRSTTSSFERLEVQAVPEKVTLGHVVNPPE